MGCTCRWRLQRFCCCCTLRTGSIITGSVDLILGLIGIALAQVGISEERNKTNEDNVDVYKDISDLLDPVANSFVFQIVWYVSFIIGSVLLFWGICKKKRGFMVFWLVFECVDIFSAVFYAFYHIRISIQVIEDAGVNAEVILMSIFPIPFITLMCYSWLCVWSHYMELGEMNQPPVHYTAEAKYKPMEDEKEIV